MSKKNTSLSVGTGASTVGKSYRDLVASSDLAILISNRESGRKFVNRACADLFGYESAEEILAGKPGDLIVNEDRSGVFALNNPLYTGEIGSATYEFQGVRKDGTPLFIQTVAQLVLWDDQTALQQTFIDQTARKKAEEQLKAREALLEKTQQIANMGSWEWIIDTGDLVWSDQIYRIFGTEPGAFVPTYDLFLERIHPDDRATVTEAVDRAIRDRKSYDVHHRIVLPGGEIRHVHEQGVAEYDCQGKPARMTGAVQDVTEKTLSAKALSESRAMLSGILSIAEEAIILVNNELRIILFSLGAQRIFGYSEEEAIGMSLDRLIPERSRHIHGEHVRDFADGDKASIRMGARSDVVGLRRNGEEFPAAVSLSKFPTGDGLLYSVILRDIGSDIAARDELIQAKLTAEAANEAKSTFLANMSHELRTPLNAIIGFSETIKGEMFGPVGNPRYLEYLDDINYAGKHLLKIINDVLDLSKIEAGDVMIEEEDVKFAEIVDTCIMLVEGRADEGGVAILKDIPAFLPELRVDSRMIKQMLVNLLANAIKFTPPGGTVEIAASCDRGAEFIIRVIDTGIGMKTEDIQTALTPFKQIDNKLNRKFEGTGLGLPLSKFFAERHGGVLKLESEIGVGTVVTVRLPPECIIAENSYRLSHSSD